MHRYLLLLIILFLLLPATAQSWEYTSNSCYSWGGDEYYSDCNAPFKNFYRFDYYHDTSGWMAVTVGDDTYTIKVEIYHVYGVGGDPTWDCEGGAPARYFPSEQCAYGTAAGFQNWDACDNEPRKNLLYCIATAGNVSVESSTQEGEQFAANIEIWLTEVDGAVLYFDNTNPELPSPWDYQYPGSGVRYAIRPTGGYPWGSCP